jgi:CubicO group peptidase (beta-lactamase class C family)
MKSHSVSGTQIQCDWAEKSAAVDDLFSAWTQGKKPGVGVAILYGGQPVHIKGYGLADLATGAAIHSKTPFRLASLTKQFTAMAIMILAEAGSLKYDDPIQQYLPQFSSYGEKITIRHLLNHTSGVEDYEELFLDAGIIDTDYPTPADREPKGFEPSLRDAVDLLSNQRLRFMPGDEWEYSNSGYVLLANIVERVSGIPFSRFLQDKIFRPLLMHDSLLSSRAQPEPELSDRARGYVFNEGVYTEADYTPLNAIYGPDGAYSTLDDMIKWCQALGSANLVRPSTMSEALTSGELNSGARTGYGLGWFIAKNFGLPVVSHTGSWMGFRSFLSYYTQQQFAIVVLSNSTEFDDAARSFIGSKLSKLYLSDEWLAPRSVAVEHNISRRYVGKYELQSGEVFEINDENGTLLVKPALFETKLIAESKVKFFAEDAESDSYFFHEDLNGKVNGLTRYLSLFGYSKDAYNWARKLNI